MAKEKKRTEIKAEINMRAWIDPKFKRDLIANPKKTIEQFGGHFSSRSGRGKGCRRRSAQSGDYPSYEARKG